MNYEYTNNTLLHSIGFNFQRLESILEYGIVSYNNAQKIGIKYNKNYLPDKQNQDYISFTKVGNIMPNNTSSAFNVYVRRGISFIIEDQLFITDKENFHIHRIDEVLVKDYVPIDKIKGIIIPSEFENYLIKDLPIIPTNITKYDYLYNIVMDYINYLKSYDANIDIEVIVDYLREILLINQALYSLKEENSIDKDELINDYREVLDEINCYLAEVTFECFSKILNKDATLKDVVEYLTKNKWKIYDIPFRINNKNQRLS